MKEYTILANPGHNRIYFDTAMKIAGSELEAIGSSHNIEMSEVKEEQIGLSRTISFSTEKALEKEHLKSLSFSSIYYALFENVEEGLLRPIDVPDFHVFPESMVQILKYNGKTNEQFTRMMVNLALSACKTNSSKITLFDPMCGKGTTLYEGFIRGFEVVGTEINKQWTQEIQTYVVRFLKEGRYKHKTAKAKPSDTRQVDQLVKKASCDIIISDLPYGVQHGSKKDKEISMARSPLALLREALPAWHQVLKTKGSIVLSYNEFTMKYEDVQKVLEEKGFVVLNEPPFSDYLHRVDQSINRNVIVAIKKKGD